MTLPTSLTKIAAPVKLLSRVLLLAGLGLLGALPAASAPTGSDARTGLPSKVQADPFRKEPYLIFPGDPDRMQVLWQLVATDTSTIEWGADSTFAAGTLRTSEYGVDHQHTATLTGLAPGQHYLYRVTAQGISHGGAFNAAPDSGTSLSFLAYGDTRSNPSVHDQVAAAMLATWAGHPENQTLAVVTGDLVNTGTAETDWTNQFFSALYPHIREFLAKVPYQSCMGNHEGSGSLFTKYFPYPFVGGRYWSFDYGPAHFAIVDQYTSYVPGSPQLQWLANDLATTTKPWKFICLHEPGWSAGGDHPNNTAVQAYIQPLCVQYGVKIVFGGHNHYYARAVVDGVHHLTIGGGGAPLYVPVTVYPNVVASASTYHYCAVNLHGDQMHFEARTPAGALVDSFSVRGQTAVVCSDFGAEAEPGAVNLHWSARLDGPAQFQVQRSARSDDGFVPVGEALQAQAGARNFTWRDAQVNPSTEYYYRIGWSETGAWNFSAPLRVTTPAERFELRSIAPNPLGTGPSRIEFALARAGRARVDIYDAAGRRACTVADAAFAAGRSSVTWDGRGPGGTPLPAGVYYARLTAGARTAMRKLTILR